MEKRYRYNGFWISIPHRANVQLASYKRVKNKEGFGDFVRRAKPLIRSFVEKTDIVSPYYIPIFSIPEQGNTLTIELYFGLKKKGTDSFKAIRSQFFPLIDKLQEIMLE